MDNLAAARTMLNDIQSPEVKQADSFDLVNGLVNTATAYILLDIAENLRWFKEQIAWEIDNGTLFGQTKQDKDFIDWRK